MTHHTPDSNILEHFFPKITPFFAENRWKTPKRYVEKPVENVDKLWKTNLLLNLFFGFRQLFDTLLQSFPQFQQPSNH